MARPWALVAALVVIASLGFAACGEESRGSATSPASTKNDDAPRVVVTAFDDESRARIDNLGGGVADKLAAQLAAGGAHVIGRAEIESLMQAERLDPTSVADLARAARDLGADFLVSGIVKSVVVNSATLDLGFVQLGSADARVAMTAELVEAAAGGAVATAAAEGIGKGEGTLSLDFGSLLGGSATCNVCSGGLQSAEAAYSQGELISIGYANPSSAGWFGVEIYASDGTFLRWLGWRFVEEGGCETWIWNQRDALGTIVPVGIYTARLRDGDSLTASVSFQVRPSLTFALPSLDQVTVGTSAFDSDVVGTAVNDAVSQLAKSLLPSILARRTSASAVDASQGSSQLLGQIASVLPNGQVMINLGTANGVSVGDRFAVLTVDNLVFEPTTQSIASYDVVANKGVVEVVDVRDRASTGTRLSDFDVLVGDLVRRLP